MDLQPTKEDLATWNKYLEAVRNYREVSRKLHRTCYWPNRQTVLVDILRKALANFEDRFYVLEVIKWMEAEYQQMLIDELLPFAAMLETKRSSNLAEEIILSWPRQWLDSHLENHARTTMRRVEKEEYRFTDLAEFYSGLIGIFRQVNLRKAKQLADEAATHPDPDVRSIGESWLTDSDWSGMSI